MKHDLFIDGTVTKFSWYMKSEQRISEETRNHPPAYYSGGKLNVKNEDESKFIALHVGIYWGLGVYIIKNNDMVNAMCDSKLMYDVFCNEKKIDNQIINDKIFFINQLTNQRGLELNFHFIKQNENMASKLIR